MIVPVLFYFPFFFSEFGGPALLPRKESSRVANASRVWIYLQVLLGVEYVVCYTLYFIPILLVRGSNGPVLNVHRKAQSIA